MAVWKILREIGKEVRWVVDWDDHVCVCIWEGFF